MLVRFLVDRDTDLPHIANHGVSEIEVLEILQGLSYHGPGKDGARIAEGQTHAGRYLRVIYRNNEVDGSVLVITAYDLTNKAKSAYRKRRKRKP